MFDPISSLRRNYFPRSYTKIVFLFVTFCWERRFYPKFTSGTL